VAEPTGTFTSVSCSKYNETGVPETKFNKLCVEFPDIINIA